MAPPPQPRLLQPFRLFWASARETFRAPEQDRRSFAGYCQGIGASVLPALPETVREIAHRDLRAL
jgi:hypothetical protein